MAGTEDVGTLVARVVADTEQFRAELVDLARKTETNTSRMNAALARAGKVAGSIGQDFRALRGELAAIGVVLSVRAFERWIASALDVNKLTEEQRRHFQAATEAIASFRDASDELARTIGTGMAPAIEASAAAINRFNAAFGDFASASTAQQITLTEALIRSLKDSVYELDGSMHELTTQQLADIAALEAKVKELRNEQYRQLTGAPKGFVGPVEALGEIKVPATKALEPLPSFEPLKVGGIDTSRTPELSALGNSPADALQTFKDASDELTQYVKDNALEQQRAMIDAWVASSEAAQRGAQEEIASRAMVAGAAIGFLQAVGAKHRGAAIAALAIQKVLAVKEILIQSEVAAARALAELGPIAGPPVAAAIRVRGKISAALVAATGLVEAAQISSGGTQATLGTSANPIATRDESPGGSTLAASVAARRQDAVKVYIQGDIYGWDSYIEKRVVAGIRDAVDGRDVVIIGPNSRQAELLAAGG